MLRLSCRRHTVTRLPSWNIESSFKSSRVWGGGVVSIVAVFGGGREVVVVQVGLGPYVVCHAVVGRFVAGWGS